MRLPPPDMMMPFWEMSLTSSGGVRSSTMCMLSSMSLVGSISASASSAEETCTVLGRPVTRSRPLYLLHQGSPGGGTTLPMAIFSSSAVFSPTRTL